MLLHVVVIPDCETPVDLCLIIDSSGSIRDNNPADGSYDNWDLQLQFLASLVGAFSISSSGTRVGAVIFSEQVVLGFYLDTYNTKEEIQRAITSTPYIGQTTNTPEALIQTRTQCFNQARGDRPNVVNLAVIVTDGLPFPPTRRQPAIDEAAALRATGVTMIAIGITDFVDVDFLRQMSSPPQIEGENFFTATDFTALREISRTVAQGTCDAVIAGRYRCSSCVSNLSFLKGDKERNAIGVLVLCLFSV